MSNPNVLQVLVANGAILHTLLNASGTWQGCFGNVNSVNDNSDLQFSQVDGTGVGSTLHVCGVASDGKLYHTYRNADGSWQGSFTSLNSFGPCLDVSCTSIDTTLHACTVSNYTGLIVHASSDNWQNTDSAPYYASSSGARFFTVSCTNVDGNLHAAGQVTSTDMHIVRDASGNWLMPYDDLNAENSNGLAYSAPLALAGTM